MKAFLSFVIAGSLLAVGCSDQADPDNLDRRAYVVSRDSDELTVIDLDTLTIVSRVPTGARSAHMAEVSNDGSKVYISSSDSNEIIVVDARTLERIGTIEAGLHPTHLAASPTTSLIGVMNEDASSVSFIDTRTDTEVAEIPGFATPHFIRYGHDGKTAYVANIGAHHISVVDLEQLAITGSVVLDGYQGPPDFTPAEDETGFADAQIAPDGMLYAAHARTGRVLVYDTGSKTKMPEVAVGTAPWVAFAEHPFEGVSLTHLVTNLGDATVSLIDGASREVAATLPGDPESYGVNVTPLAPDRAYVMNRIGGDISVIDTSHGTLVERIPVGGNTETAATSADGRYVVAAVSGADRVVIIDAATGAIAEVFDGIGAYPWSVTIPRGQNYCH
jgi:YVTN family beta-propeller protein